MTSVGEDLEKREPSYTAAMAMQIGGDIMENNMEIPPKLRIELPYDPAIPLLGIYLKNMKTLTRKDICTPMFIAALFTITKILEQPKCPLTDEWIKKMWYIYTREYYSAIMKDKIVPFATT
uniref:Uncharacterized protein n=1 Tax=Equus caballus TaxID=9796 RepID=A0A9L0SZ91_HORSE